MTPLTFMWLEKVHYPNFMRRHLAIHAKNEHERGNLGEVAVRALDWTHSVHNKKRNKKSGG